MPVVEELIRTEQDGTISFGNYKLGQKSKKSDFEYQGDIYKVKTYNEITKLLWFLRFVITFFQIYRTMRRTFAKNQSKKRSAFHHLS